MQWPYGWMIASFTAAGIAIFMPWLAGKRRRFAGLACAVLAISMYCAYEIVLKNRAQPGDPLIRVELFLLYPLLITAVVSCLIAVAMPRLGRSKDATGTWQYSTAGLLIVMTLVAIFFGMLAVLTR